MTTSLSLHLSGSLYFSVVGGCAAGNRRAELRSSHLAACAATRHWNRLRCFCLASALAPLQQPRGSAPRLASSLDLGYSCIFFSTWQRFYLLSCPKIKLALPTLGIRIKGSIIAAFRCLHFRMIHPPVSSVTVRKKRILCHLPGLCITRR